MRVKMPAGFWDEEGEILPDVDLARRGDGEEEGAEMSLSRSTATFRAICEERPDTLPSITLDLRDEDLEALAPKARAAWERLQALFAEEDA